MGKTLLPLCSVAALLLVAACDQGAEPVATDTTTGTTVDTTTDTTTMPDPNAQRAETLENQAEQVREQGEQQADVLEEKADVQREKADVPDAMDTTTPENQ